MSQNPQTPVPGSSSATKQPEQQTLGKEQKPNAPDYPNARPTSGNEAGQAKGANPPAIPVSPTPPLGTDAGNVDPKLLKKEERQEAFQMGLDSRTYANMKADPEALDRAKAAIGEKKPSREEREDALAKREEEDAKKEKERTERAQKREKEARAQRVSGPGVSGPGGSERSERPEGEAQAPKAPARA